MELDERDFHDEDSNFNDRIDQEIEIFSCKNDESEPQKEEDFFYRHLDDY